MICRMRLDAAFYDNPLDSPPGKRVPKATKGTRQLNPRQQAADAKADWREVEVSWYGGRRQVMQVLGGMGLWTAPRVKPLPLNSLITRDPSGTHRDAVYFCTEGWLDPATVLGLVVQRWSLEVTFAELRARLGMETQR